MEVVLPGFTVNSHFLNSEYIEINLLPEDVDSAEKAEDVFRLMIAISDILAKEVFLTPEFGSATPEKLRELAVRVVDAKRNLMRSRFDDE